MNLQLPWHASQWHSIEAWQDSDRLPHALLLAGPPGLGKMHFAERLSERLLCENTDGRVPACGQCVACRLMLSGSHPDRFLVRPEEKKRAIGIDAIRELGRQIGLTGTRQGRKVALLHPAEAMTRAAANALLKTLEEPPPENTLLLVADNPALLPATIRSRCQRLAFAPSFAPATAEWIARQLDDDSPCDPLQLLYLAQGAPLRALQFAREGGLDARRAVLDGLETLAGRGGEPVAVAEGWLKLGLNPVSYWMHSVLSDLARLAGTAAPPFLLNRDALPLLQGFTKRLDYTVIFQLLDWCTDARRVIDLGQNLNPQLLIEDLAIRWHRALNPR